MPVIPQLRMSKSKPKPKGQVIKRKKRKGSDSDDDDDDSDHNTEDISPLKDSETVSSQDPASADLVISRGSSGQKMMT